MADLPASPAPPPAAVAPPPAPPASSPPPAFPLIGRFAKPGIFQAEKGLHVAVHTAAMRAAGVDLEGHAQVREADYDAAVSAFLAQESR